MDFAPVAYDRLPKTSALFLDYVSRYDRVAQFYNGSPYDPASFKAVANQLKFGASERATLVEILIRQNQAFGSGSATLENIQRLRDSGTYAVVTGQQVGLLSGPAFTIYKALTAVRLAQALSERGVPSVPVFWLATEDHDLEEVAQTATFDDEYNLVELKDPGDRPAPHSAVGRVKLTGEINTAIQLLENALPAGGPRERIIHDLRDCYQPGVSWGQSFGKFIARVFSPWGVVLLDPLDEGVHRLSAQIYAQVIEGTPALKKRLLERSDVLVQNGYSAQVHVGEDSTLLFVARDGNRTALDEKNGAFSLNGSSGISSAELKAMVEKQPLDFSPNALLRPFVQDKVLPTIAYVAGPSELAYLAQSQVLYHEWGRPQPIIFPRAGFTLIDARSQRVMEKYRISVDDVWQGEEHLRRAIAANAFNEGWSGRLDDAEQGFTQLLEQLRKDVETIDPTLLDPLKHTQEKIKHQMDQLKGKISRAAMTKSQLLARHEQSLQRFLLPRKHLQEREVSGVYFLGRAGYELLDRMYAQIRTDSSQHQVLAY